ncbi:dynamin family protein [Litchfieldia salsa]|uniref:Dynamin family protein n=1 Tax=Litchfieldia salsa TaxID=930152 RepID=A0A1H0TJ66_9BACI|nr:dynamin family protein [Litchfieldia salsa]SDP53596.1 Dynamin family protein [Litchfieldia salsa]
MIDVRGHVKVSKEELLHRLTAIYQEMKDDQEHAKKMIQLIKKLNQSQFMIGFCGHFSAGKSSMINELIGEELLPSSPIPTSANLVMVKSGRAYARVYYKNNEIIEYPAPYNYDVIKEYCKDGEEIESLEISHETRVLKEGITIMDTPGIDSTDDAHRVATESALHLADLLFYVMDYNHVQSELNFQFTKEMTDRNKTIYLIINQIDKHQETELSFESFQQSVEQGFNDYQVFPDGIFYTSLRADEHPFNQLSEVKKLINEKIIQKDELLFNSIINSTHQIIEEHLIETNQIKSSEKEKLEDLISSLSDNERQIIPNQVKDLEGKLRELDAKRDQARTNFMEGFNKVLHNAYLMPFSTRELAKSYIESCQEEFKVGFLFSKSKTDQERQTRLNHFYHDLQEKVNEQIEWHLKDYVNSYLKENQLNQLLSKVEVFETGLNKDILTTSYKAGARLTGDYVLTYTEDVANEIKKQYRQIGMRFLDDISIHIEAKIIKEIKELESELQIYKSYQEAILKLEDMKYERVQKKGKLQDILNNGEYQPIKVNFEQLIKEDRVIKTSSTEDLMEMNKFSTPELSERPNLASSSSNSLDEEERVQNTINDLLKVKSEIETIKGLSTLAKDMADKAERLDQNQFTVALFGAFSAGKSSFANALIGSHVLPVSPNPTTATINKIKPPSDMYPHGTVVVKIKSKEQLLTDLSHSLQMFDKDAENLDLAISSIKKLINDKAELGSKEKPHFRFLKAVSDGFEAINGKLDQQLIASMDEFKEYVAVEEKACFVEWIELYYDCEITRKGITLVDTPGADSINARHTGVAFNYIKNADAILFVTYYNHAFSKADREFLIQLGRVKDTFSMDKMFFIINAADLASSLSELEDVKEYVSSQLIRYGIKTPRLYALSSQMAIKEKITANTIQDSAVLNSSNIADFEKDFHQFIVSELIDMTIVSSYEDIHRAKTIIDYYIESAMESKEEKRQKLERVIKQEAQMQEIIHSRAFDIEKKALEQEISELVFYIKQRVFLRYSDFFKEAFNPVTLRDDGRDLRKSLIICLNELIESVGFDLSQEMRATSLRIERFLHLTTKDILGDLNQKLSEIDEHIMLPKSVKHEFAEIVFETGLQDLDQGQFKKALSLFKNPKAFFEKNEKKLMSDEIDSILQSPVTVYLEEQKERLIYFYSHEFYIYIEELRVKSLKEIDEYFVGIKQALSEEVNVEKLIAIQNLLFKLEEKNER